MKCLIKFLIAWMFVILKNPLLTTTTLKSIYICRWWTVCTAYADIFILFSDWKAPIETDGPYTKTDKARMFILWQTHEALIITTHPEPYPFIQLREIQKCYNFLWPDLLYLIPDLVGKKDKKRCNIFSGKKRLF